MQILPVSATPFIIPIPLWWRLFSNTPGWSHSLTRASPASDGTVHSLPSGAPPSLSNSSEPKRATCWVTPRWTLSSFPRACGVPGENVRGETCHGPGCWGILFALSGFISAECRSGKRGKANTERERCSCVWAAWPGTAWPGHCLPTSWKEASESARLRPVNSDADSGSHLPSVSLSPHTFKKKESAPVHSPPSHFCCNSSELCEDWQIGHFLSQTRPSGGCVTLSDGVSPPAKDPYSIWVHAAAADLSQSNHYGLKTVAVNKKERFR